MKNTLILEKSGYSPRAVNCFKSLGRVYFFEDLSTANKKEVLLSINILVIRLGYKIAAAWLDKMPKLELIVTSTTGLNHIDLDEANRRKIKIISLKGHSDFLKSITSTAEEALALILSLARHIPWAFADVKNGNWDREKWKGLQLTGKRLGLLGLGRLGKIMARYGLALGMEVLAADPDVSETTMKHLGVKKLNIKKLFEVADFLSVHVNLEKNTVNLVTKELFGLMKDGAYFINTSRGEIVDERALLSALKNKKIAGAALDVMKDEVGGRHLNNNPLVEYAKINSNLLIVPHLGGATCEAMRITEEYVAKLVLKHYQYGK